MDWLLRLGVIGAPKGGESTRGPAKVRSVTRIFPGEPLTRYTARDGGTIKLVEFISEEAIQFRLGAMDVRTALTELAAKLGPLSGIDAAVVRNLLAEREHLGSTALGDEVAVPHAKADVPRVIGVLAIAQHGIDFRSPDRRRSRIVVAFVSPREGAIHLKALAAVAEAFSDSEIRSRLLEAATPSDVYSVIASL
jgi:PTS system nitrogen regulatory IIA component